MSFLHHPDFPSPYGLSNIFSFRFIAVFLAQLPHCITWLDGCSKLKVGLLTPSENLSPILLRYFQDTESLLGPFVFSLIL